MFAAISRRTVWHVRHHICPFVVVGDVDNAIVPLAIFAVPGFRYRATHKSLRSGPLGRWYSMPQSKS
jgi:hypothetical protein